MVGIIQDSPRHLDAAALLKAAKQKDPNIDRATVYRTIALLKHLGLIDELDLMHLEGEKHYYEAKTVQARSAINPQRERAQTASLRMAVPGRDGMSMSVICLAPQGP